MDRWRTAGTAVVAVLALAGGAGGAGGAGAPAALAHGTPAVGTSEHKLFAEDSAALGREHALEHRAARRASQRAAARWRTLSPRERRARERTLARAAQAEQAVEHPAVDGRWSAPFHIPAFAINAAMLPTGKILFYSYPYQGGTRPERGTAYVWDPAAGTGPSAFEAADPPLVAQPFPDAGGSPAPAQLFCSGQSFLPDGQLLVTGGNLFWWGQPEAPPTATNYAGVRQAFTFDPWKTNGTYWKRQPDMSVGRWYPSQVELADGRTFVIAGLTDQPGAGGVYGQYTDKTDVFTPGTGLGSLGTMEPGQASSQRYTEFYPHLFLLPNGDVALAGSATVWPGASGILRIDPQTGDMAWDSAADSNMNRATRTYAAAVLAGGDPEGSGDVTMIGGYGQDGDDNVIDGKRPATATTETRDFLSSDKAWRTGPSLDIARSNVDTVVLPDGSLVTVGGGTGNDNGNQYIYDPSQRQVELFDGTSWRLGAAQQRRRTYHATALLMPDGRIWSAGDDGDWKSYNGGTNPLDPTDGDAAEIYSPPYLFNADGSPAARPVIQTAPGEAPWDVPFYVSTPDDIARAVLMAPGAVTHKVDMNQRQVELRVVRRDAGHGLVLQAPPSAAVAPPGYYMLFLLDAHGVPSVATWVRLGADAAAPTVPDPPTDPGDGNPGGGPGGGDAGGGDTGGDPGSGDQGGGTPSGGSGGGDSGGGTSGGGAAGVGGSGGGPSGGGSSPLTQPSARVLRVRAATLRRHRLLKVALRLSRPGRVWLRVTVGRGRKLVRVRAVTRRLHSGRRVVRLRIPRSALRRGAPRGSVAIAVDIRQEGAAGVRHVVFRAR